MILSQTDLKEAFKSGQIAFDPQIEDAQWGQASIDLRLGFKFTRLNKLDGVTVSVAQGLGTLGTSGFWISKELKEKDEFGNRETFKLGPGEFVLAMTYEAVTVPNNMIALVEGRSTYARVGLSMHQTAPWIQPGWKGPIVLEIMNHGPLHVELTPVVDRPCQLTFFELKTPLDDQQAYGAKAGDVYQGQKHPLIHPTKK